uniref:SAM-dependent MTase RsmB/NOP-type domain-containing protein n=1 Tax=Timspurckia oligopyrenoides TaxID=708627 RepID=A0A7S0ZAX3_9RHOD|mmetsp:Transcript_10662/g.19242  ORF Transcript_10662/g.19242 Transcript_10662/m.19242 type:complete len:475 (+) Transcript_10662:933-2357(+)
MGECESEGYEIFGNDVDSFLQQYYSASEIMTLRNTVQIPPDTTIRINTLLVTDSETQVVSKLEEYIKSLPIYSEVDFKSMTDFIRMHPKIPDLVVIKTTGPHLIDSNEIEKRVPKVWVDRICAEAVLRGANVFAPGVKAAEFKVEVGCEVEIHADLDDRITKGSTFAHSGNVNDLTSPKTLHIGNGIAQFSREDMFGNSENSVRSGIAVVVTHPLYRAPPLNGILKSLIYPQNLPSVLVAHVLNPQPNEYVMDMCASPGGKTSHIAALMQNQGRIIALDKNTKKIQQLKSTLDELQVSMVRSFAQDATKYRKYIMNENENPNLVNTEEGKPLRLQRESFDRILVDASCSALGMRPRLRHSDVTREQLESYPKHQMNILRAAVMLLKVNGILTYSTCTLNPNENEGNVFRALSAFPLQLEAPDDPKFMIGSHGRLDMGLSEQQACLVQRFDLSHPDSNSNPAFFCARFRKTAHFN